MKYSGTMKVIPFGAEIAYSRIVRSMPWLLMPWLPVLPRNWKLWYWIWMINRFVSSTKKEFNIFCRLSAENCWKSKYIFMFHSKKQPQQSLSNPGWEKCHDQFQNKALACYLDIISHKIIALVTQAWKAYHSLMHQFYCSIWSTFCFTQFEKVHLTHLQ